MRRRYGILGVLVFGFLAAPLCAGGWTSYFLPQASELPRVHDILEQNHLGPVVSPQSATTLLNNYGELEEVPLKDISQRLLPQDPRWTPYLHQLEGFFQITVQGRQGVFFNLPDQLPAAQVTGLLAAQGIQVTPLGPGSPARGGLPFWLILVLWVGFAGVLAYQYRRRPILALSTGLLLFFFFFLSKGELFYQTTGLYFILLESLSFLFKFFRLQGEGRPRTFTWKDPRVLTLAGSLVFLMALSAIQGLSAEAWGLLGLSVLASTLLVLFVKHRKSREVMALEHRLFRPERLCSSPSPKLWIRGLRPALGFILPLFPVMLFSGPLVSAPVYAGGGSLKELRQQWETDQHRQGPSASGFAAHLAHQEGFLFGRSFHFPAENETLTILGYQEKDSRLQEVPRVILTFDEAWLQSRLAARSPLALERVFFQGPSQASGASSPGETRPSFGNFLPFIVLGILVFLAGRLAEPTVSGLWSRGLNLRREFLV